MSRTEAEFERVKQLVSEGLSDYAIARTTGIPRPTVRCWRRRNDPPRSASRRYPWQVTDPDAYCYVLGCYLGDGHVNQRSANGWELRIACDQRYPGIMAEIGIALVVTFPGSQPTRFAASTGASDVLRISHPGVAAAFPQHGRGPKHRRAIALAKWQAELTHAHPAALVRGLIHSDGCRAANRFKTRLPSGRVAEHSYIRYFFSNMSSDIRQIFQEHCEVLGIRVTQSNPRNLSVSRRDSVAILEQIVGEKT
ncbi:MAG TPA: helix-turn-helix domain-containing protein [Solirubrobacteraceae bacterium]|jgi:hypothetical protein